MKLIVSINNLKVIEQLEPFLNGTRLIVFMVLPAARMIFAGAGNTRLKFGLLHAG